MRDVVLSILAALPLVACAEGVDPEVADPAVSSHEQELVWWHWHTETWASLDPYRGGPAWADDDSDAASVELRYQRRLSLPPLQGWWDRRDFSFRPFVQTPDGGGKRFVVDAPLAGQPIWLDYVKSEGYLLVARFVPEVGGTEVLRIGLDGAVAPLAAEPTPWLVSRDVVPSPDGGVLADVRCTLWDEVTGDGVTQIVPLDPAACAVTFLDAATLAPVGGVATAPLAWPSPGQPPVIVARWTPAGALVVAADTSAFEATLDGAASAVPVPACRGPQTTTSKVASDRRRVGVGWFGNLTVVDADPDAPDAFGCP